MASDRERCRQLLANVEFIQALTAPPGSRLYSPLWRWLVRAVIAVFPVFVLLLSIVMTLTLVYLNVVPTEADVRLVRYARMDRAPQTKHFLTDFLSAPLDVWLCPRLNWGYRSDPRSTRAVLGSTEPLISRKYAEKKDLLLPPPVAIGFGQPPWSSWSHAS